MTKRTTPPGSKRRVLLGEITGAHGIKGEVMIRSFTEPPDGIGAYGPLESESGSESYVVRVKRVTDRGVIAELENVSDRTAAERLKGVRLFVDRTRLPPLAPGEYYRYDLIGLVACDATGEVIGTVIDVVNYGASDILEIRLMPSKRVELIPLEEAFVPRIDVDGGKLFVVIPEASPDDEPGPGVLS
jgi:16S rRNA processing protein RimM